LRATSVSSCAGAAPGRLALMLEADQAQHGQQDEEHHRRDGVADAPSGNVHGRLLTFKIKAL
jgi:hypothetical protein